jgi:hypothetical protein
MRLIIVFPLILLVMGCGIVSYESVYEGFRSQQKANGLLNELKPEALPSFHQYDNERNELKK